MSAISTRIDEYLCISLHTGNNDAFWDFVILWNLFESRLFGSGYSPKKITALSLKVPSEVIQKTLFYFKGRYVEKGLLNRRYELLRLRGETDKQPLVEDVLLGKQTAEDAQIEAIIIIIGRYRNNLFHGLKEISSIDLQKENFDIANEFLMTVLECNTKC